MADFNVRKPQTINRLINELTKWSTNRKRNELSAYNLDQAVEVCNAYLSLLGWHREGNNVTRDVPMMSLGLMEQVQMTILAIRHDEPHYKPDALDAAERNMATLMTEARRITAYATAKEEIAQVAVSVDSAGNVIMDKDVYPPTRLFFEGETRYAERETWPPQD